MNSLCCLCGSDNVQFLRVGRAAVWPAAEEVRHRSARYSVEPYCESCVVRPRSLGSRIVTIDLHAAI